MGVGWGILGLQDCVKLVEKTSSSPAPGFSVQDWAGFSANTPPPGCFMDGLRSPATCGGSHLGLLSSCATLNEFDNLSEP